MRSRNYNACLDLWLNGGFQSTQELLMDINMWVPEPVRISTNALQKYSLFSPGKEKNVHQVKHTYTSIYPHMLNVC